MEISVWVSGLTALVGVGLGGLLSARAQARAWGREELRLWQDTRRATYGQFIAAVREYRLFVSGPDAQVEVWIHPEGKRLIPAVGRDGSEYQEKMEAAFTAVQLVAQDQETVDRAHLLTSLARRIAVARAVYGPGRVPTELDEGLFDAEREFLKSARRDLNLRDMDAVPFPESLMKIDAEILAEHQRHTHDFGTEPQ